MNYIFLILKYFHPFHYHKNPASFYLIHSQKVVYLGYSYKYLLLYIHSYYYLQLKKGLPYSFW